MPGPCAQRHVMPVRCRSGGPCCLLGITLLRLSVPPSLRPLYNRPAELFNTTTSWGGSVVKDTAGQYHMYLAEMANGCGMNTWSTNSIIRWVRIAERDNDRENAARAQHAVLMQAGVALGRNAWLMIVHGVVGGNQLSTGCLSLRPGTRYRLAQRVLSSARRWSSQHLHTTRRRCRHRTGRGSCTTSDAATDGQGIACTHTRAHTHRVWRAAGLSLPFVYFV